MLVVFFPRCSQMDNNVDFHVAIRGYQVGKSLKREKATEVTFTLPYLLGNKLDVRFKSGKRDSNSRP